MNFDNIFNILNINNKIEYYNCNRLKNILDKGFKTGTINEIIGMPYTGKTKLIIDLINESCDEKIVLYITTNNNSNDLFNKYLENTDNVVLVFNNQENYIKNIIKSSIKDIDLIILFLSFTGSTFAVKLTLPSNPIFCSISISFVCAVYGLNL